MCLLITTRMIRKLGLVQQDSWLITAVLRSYQEKFQLDLYLEVFYGLYTKKWKAMHCKPRKLLLPSTTFFDPFNWTGSVSTT